MKMRVLTAPEQARWPFILGDGMKSANVGELSLRMGVAEDAVRCIAAATTCHALCFCMLLLSRTITWHDLLLEQLSSLTPSALSFAQKAASTHKLW